MVFHIHSRPSERAMVLATVLALHAGFLLLVLVTGATRRPRPPVQPSLTIVSLAADPVAPAAAPPPPPTMKSKVVELPRPLAELVVADHYAVDSNALPAGGCAMIDLVSKALTSDPAAVAAISRAPAEARSVADAIVLWNAGWSDAAQTIDGPLAIVRAVAERRLRAAEPACLDEEISGPRLIPIPAGERTNFIVIGSGKWRWADLLLGMDGRPAPPFGGLSDLADAPSAP